ncbi:hypothetical protein TD95_004261 [Thielaviopsis punctulata]|uniref:3-hydroxy-3-methylglutaryl coenzyme A reductase n=1 Tax=Thielaviopsis punctulata TaxID=72032 RepID=A0A0F4Z7N2_9PEZI|nr:hypothetical protein TD95_004261 [Thielaviopsis punctulata]
MMGSLLPRRFRGEQPASKAPAPSWLNKKVTPFISLVSRLACSHPIHTVVMVTLLGSTTYVGLLQDSFFDITPTFGKADWASLAEGSRTLTASSETAWKWQTVESEFPVGQDNNHLALVTLQFPGSTVAPLAAAVPHSDNISLNLLPTSPGLGSSLVFSLPYIETPEFLIAAQEIPADNEEAHVAEDGSEQKMWIMNAAKVSPQATIAEWANNSWNGFVDLVQNAETLDIVIMVLGYLSMHLTFVSLFMSMRRMGSNFWLAASVLFSSSLAFLFGLLVTTSLGVPINMVLLSEGLPFLVVTIGFEKNIVLTRAVLSHAVEHRKRKDDGKNKSKDVDASSIQYAVQAAIKDKGYDIVYDYAVEIAILVLGVLSGVQGGLQQFCFLAAWILFFDCLLVFTFYTAILSIKLEINRIKRHFNVQKALEDDGVSHRVAANVAKGEDSADGTDSSQGTMFGAKIKRTSIPKFKVLMVSGFVLVNVMNLCTIPFRNSNSLARITSWAGGSTSLITSQQPLDPYQVASKALDSVIAAAQVAATPVTVTVLNAIPYELVYPSVHYGIPTTAASGGLAGEAGLKSYGVGGRMVGGILKSLEDPVLSKWIIVALAMSVALNGYLFNAARWGIKDPNMPASQIDRKELARAQNFNDSSNANMTLGEYMPPSARQTPVPKSFTPAPTDDEEDALSMKPISAKPGDDAEPRPLAHLEALLKADRAFDLTDEEVVLLSMKGKLPGYALEKKLKDFTRAVKIRRSIISRTKVTESLTGSLEHSKLPYERYNWERVFGACCENVIGYLPLPVGVAGPLVIDGQSYFIPMATTEGVLVASASRGCKAINAGGGAVTVLTDDGMTRGPCVGFDTLERAGAAKLWLDSETGQTCMANAFNSTSRFARLSSIKTAIAGTNLYIRFKARTGDAMGMNMISKGVEHALSVMRSEGFEDMHIVSVSGNYCIDKKPGALNWIEGRGKSVVAEAIIPGDVVKSVLKSDVDSLVELNINKNLIGSAMAGSVGGFNAHAANLVAAVFLATGQDPAQVVESANCITIMKNLNGALQISVSMPSIEVGTLGGGTILEPQTAMLEMLGVRGPHPTNPGENARRLARIVAASVLAGELSLCSALAAGHLVTAHMQHNRSAAPSAAPTRTNTPAPNGNPGLGMTMSSAALERVKR